MLVGTGMISSTYVVVCNKLPDVSIVGVVSRSGRCPKNLSVPVFDSLANVKVAFDAIIIATPNGTHCDLIEEAAKMGKHSLVEKPLDITPEACDRIAKVSRQQKVEVSKVCLRRPTKRLFQGKMHAFF